MKIDDPRALVPVLGVGLRSAARALRGVQPSGPGRRPSRRAVAWRHTTHRSP
ncbi:putative eSX-3 secretion-associated protein EspG3 [Mycobacterium xenopi 3993]|nr:putative eSX-3 secretion-associated protein EspG3 [Mycobacterium xenopi 3993]